MSASGEWGRTMASTLIVRDVTLAVNGAPETRGELGAHLRNRAEAIVAFEEAAVRECVEVLAPHIDGDTPDPEAQQSLFLLCLGHPEICTQLGVNEINLGRELASWLEEEGRMEDAASILELLSQRHPERRGIERDLAGLMRRRGLVEDLIERYLDRAAQLTKAGKTEEAVDNLREVLLLDRSRKDVARMIRDLRYQETDEKKKRFRRARSAFITLAVSAAATLVFIHERQALRGYQALPDAAPGDHVSLSARLTALETFAGEYPVWHRALFIEQERTELKVEVERLEAKIAEQREEEEATALARLEAARMARERGLMRADSGDYETALEEFQRSLELAGDDWPPRERVERDMKAITAWLEQQER